MGLASTKSMKNRKPQAHPFGNAFLGPFLNFTNNYTTNSRRIRILPWVFAVAHMARRKAILDQKEWMLKYWRDIASHGGVSTISDDEAITSIALLLRFAHFSHDNWDRLTVRNS